MSHLDEDFLKLKRREKYAKYSTLETGIYIKDELVEFEPRDIPELNINASLPKTFVRMPLSIAKIKYPSETRPQMIFTSLDTTVNFTFSVYPQDVPLDQVKRVAEQMKAMLKKLIQPIFSMISKRKLQKTVLCAGLTIKAMRLMTRFIRLCICWQQKRKKFCMEHSVVDLTR